jgi:hypothetical protein
MTLYTLPDIPQDLQDKYLGDSYHLIYTECLTEADLSPDVIDTVLASPMLNYITVRCETLKITSIICLSTPLTAYRSHRHLTLQIMQVEVHPDFISKGNFLRFMNIMRNVATNCNRILTIMNVSSERLQLIIDKHPDKYEPLEGYASCYVVIP